MRIGQGYDVHPFAEGRRLVLGGVDFNATRGLSGHSDADVLCHAISDALLGAAALGDIGVHFPSSDEANKDADSLALLRRVNRLVIAAGCRIVNIDCTVIAQEPRIGPRVTEMRSRLAVALGIEVGQISVKATTTDGLGAIGRMEGIAAHAIALLDNA